MGRLHYIFILSLSVLLATAQEELFDLLDEEEANEFYYGHDCEGETV